MKPQVMLDLEFLGKVPTAAIAAIGAVVFDLTGIKEEFYQTVDIRTSVQFGGTLDADIVLFWLRQPDGPRFEVSDPDAVHISEALSRFLRWIPEDAEVWGNGSDCDNPILMNAFDGLGLEVPWDRHRGNRCYRTMKNMYPDVQKPPENLMLHHALEDAKWQALHLIEILKFKRNLEELGRGMAWSGFGYSTSGIIVSSVTGVENC